MRETRIDAMDTCIETLKEAIQKTDERAFEHCGTKVPALMMNWIEDIWNEAKKELTTEP